jgi:hypothetical protein
MPLGNNIITHTESQTGSFTRWFGGKKWLEYLFPNIRRYAPAIISYRNFNLITDLSG